MWKKRRSINHPPAEPGSSGHSLDSTARTIKGFAAHVRISPHLQPCESWLVVSQLVICLPLKDLSRWAETINATPTLLLSVCSCIGRDHQTKIKLVTIGLFGKQQWAAHSVGGDMPPKSIVCSAQVSVITLRCLTIVCLVWWIRIVTTLLGSDMHEFSTEKRKSNKYELVLDIDCPLYSQSDDIFHLQWVVPTMIKHFFSVLNSTASVTIQSLSCMHQRINEVINAESCSCKVGQLGSFELKSYTGTKPFTRVIRCCVLYHCRLTYFSSENLIWLCCPHLTQVDTNPKRLKASLMIVIMPLTLMLVTRACMNQYPWHGNCIQGKQGSIQ